MIAKNATANEFNSLVIKKKTKTNKQKHIYDDWILILRFLCRETDIKIAWINFCYFHTLLIPTKTHMLLETSCLTKRIFIQNLNIPYTIHASLLPYGLELLPSCHIIWSSIKLGREALSSGFNSNLSNNPKVTRTKNWTKIWNYHQIHRSETLAEMLDSCPSKLDGEMLLLCSGSWPK